MVDISPLYFTEISNNNTVSKVVLVARQDCLDSSNKYSDELGKEQAIKYGGDGVWVMATADMAVNGMSDITVGSVYVAEHNMFVRAKPFDSWALNPELRWVSPTPYPEDTNTVHSWNELTKAWENTNEVSTQPFKGWTKNSSSGWEPSVPYPEDDTKIYVWDEVLERWVEKHYD